MSSCEHEYMLIYYNKIAFFACLKCKNAEPIKEIKKTNCKCENINWKINSDYNEYVVYCENCKKKIYYY